MNIEIDSKELIILKPQEAAKRLRCSAAQIYKLSNSGQLPHIRIGRNIGILESDLTNFILINRYPKPKAHHNVR